MKALLPWKIRFWKILFSCLVVSATITAGFVVESLMPKYQHVSVWSHGPFVTALWWLGYPGMALEFFAYIIVWRKEILLNIRGR
jgi:hypothetical protein